MELRETGGGVRRRTGKGAINAERGAAVAGGSAGREDPRPAAEEKVS